MPFVCVSPLATIIVQQGTLRAGCVLISGNTWGRVRTLLDAGGRPVETAGPSSPVVVAGWKGLPGVGERCTEVDKEREAKEELLKREEQKAEAARDAAKEGQRTAVKPWRRKEKAERKPRRRRQKRAVEEEEKEEEGGELHVPVMVKGDVVGSVEAVEGVLAGRKPSGVRLSLLRSGVGPVTEGDVEMAAAANGKPPLSLSLPFSALIHISSQALSLPLMFPAQKPWQLWPSTSKSLFSHTASSTSCWNC